MGPESRHTPAREATTHTFHRVCGRLAFSLVAALVAFGGEGLPAPASSAPAFVQSATVQPSLQQLSQDVDSPDVDVRRKALRALRERGGPEILPVLARLVNDQEVGIRSEAIEYVIGIYVEPLPKQSMGSAEDAFELAPYHVTPWPVPAELTRALVRALADDYASIRRDSAYALAIVTTTPLADAAAFELLASLSDREPSVRIAAARALGRLQVKSAGVPLVGRVNDGVLEVRLAAMRALGDIREKGAVEALTEQYQFYIRGSAGRAALDALARIGDGDSSPLFEAQTDSGYPAHRQSAYEGLARTGTAKITASRIEGAMAAERDKRVRLAMAFALATAGRPTVDQIVDGLADSDTALQALAYLVELGQPAAGGMTSRLSHQDPLVRQQLVIALGFAGGPEARTALQSAASDASPEVRHAAEVAQLRLRQGR